MKLGHIFHALGWAREDLASVRQHNDPYMGRSQTGANGATAEPAKVSTSVIQRSSSKKMLENGFGNSFNIDESAAYRLANQKFDPNYMSKSDTRRMANLLHDAGAITRRDLTILVKGLEADTKIDETTPHDMVSVWQGQLHKDIAEQDFQMVDADSRALTILGRVVAGA